MTIQGATPPAGYPYPTNYIVANTKAARPGDAYTPVTASVTPEEYWMGKAVATAPNAVPFAGPSNVQTFPVPLSPAVAATLPVSNATPARSNGGAPAWLTYVNSFLALAALAVAVFKRPSAAAAPAPKKEEPTKSPATPPTKPKGDVIVPTEEIDASGNPITTQDRNTPPATVIIPQRSARASQAMPSQNAALPEGKRLGDVWPAVAALFKNVDKAKV